MNLLQKPVSRIKLGWKFATSTYQFVTKHKKIFVFMGLSNCLLGLTLSLYVAFFFSRAVTSSHSILSIKQHFSTAPLILAGIFSILFLGCCDMLSRVALSFYTSSLLQNKPISVRASFGRAFSRFWTLAKMVLIETLIGSLVRLLEGKNGSFISKLLLGLIGLTLQVAWYAITFFITPVLALQKLGIFDSLIESEGLMKKTWGETLGAQFNIGSIFFLGIMGTWALFLVPVSTIFYLCKPLTPHLTFILKGVGIVGFILPIFGVIFVGGTLMVILQTVLYHYAQSLPLGTFSPNLLQNAFASPTQN